MEALRMSYATDTALRVLDEHGELVGTIQYPLARDPLGPGRETVYLVRPAHPCARASAAA
jgi:hypothetical protein